MKEDVVVQKKRGKFIEDPTKQKQIEISAIKLEFNSTITSDLGGEGRIFLFKKFFDKCLNGTKVKTLASLLMLYQINKAIDENDLDFFVQPKREKFVTV